MERLARKETNGEPSSGWPRLKQQLAEPVPDLAVLDDVYSRFAAGHEGLGLVWFSEVRQALRRYLVTARAVGNPKVKKDYERALDELAAKLEAYRTDPLPDSATAISQILGWLHVAGQAPWVIRDVREALSSPNLFLQISDRLVSNRVGGPVDENSPVDDCILGTSVHGTGHVTGQLKAELVPSANRGTIDILFQGNIVSQNVGTNGPATIYSTGSTAIAARKRINVVPQEITSCPAQSRAETCTNIYCIDTGGRALIEKMAWKRAAQQKGEAEMVALQHAEQKFDRRMDEQAQTLIDRGNRDLVQKLRRPLVERNLYPEVFELSTTAKALQAMAIIAGDTRIAAPSTPPTADGASDLMLRAHESFDQQPHRKRRWPE